MQYVMQQLFAMQRFFALTLVLIATSFGLAGCGNKGPLYLPPETVQEVPSTPAATNVVSSEQKESSEPEETEATAETETIETE